MNHAPDVSNRIHSGANKCMIACQDFYQTFLMLEAFKRNNPDYKKNHAREIHNSKNVKDSFQASICPSCAAHSSSI
jgi:hypothetical protein